MDVLNDLAKGDGCAPQQGSMGGLANQLLRAQMLQQQQAQAPQMAAHTAHWREGMQQAMHGPQMGGPLDARFQGASPGSQMQAHPAEANWTQEFRRQQAAIMSVQNAMQMQGDASQQQRQHQMMEMQQRIMMQRQHQEMMARSMMQHPMGMGGMMHSPFMHGPMHQHFAQPQPMSQHVQQPAAQQEKVADTAEQTQAADGGGSKEADAKLQFDEAQQSEAFKRMEEAWAQVQSGEGTMDNLWEEMLKMNGLEPEAHHFGDPRLDFSRENKFITPDSKVMTYCEFHVCCLVVYRLSRGAM